MYAIRATVSAELPGWTSARQVPTFYLDERVQGITSERHAEEIARDIIMALAPPDTDETRACHITAVQV